MDVDKMELGVDFVKHIQQAVGSCDVLIAVIGRGWLTSKDTEGQPRLRDPNDFVRLEIEAGLRREDVLVVPILVQGARMPGPDEVPDSLAGLTRRHGLEVSDSRWGYDVGRLVERIKRLSAEAEAKRAAETEGARRAAPAEEAERKAEESKRAAAADEAERAAERAESQGPTSAGSVERAAPGGIPRGAILGGAAIACAVAIGAVVALSGGGGGGGGGDLCSGGTGPATIYSSLPLQGGARTQNQAIVRGAKLALEEAGSRAGACRIAYESLDDSTAADRGWNARQTAANARKAARDKSTVAYIGEFNSDATAVSLPILNEAGIAQISPSNTRVGLTVDAPGAAPGEPDKYYPTGERTFVRITPNDSVQAKALARLMRDEGCTAVQPLNDGNAYGKGLTSMVASASPRVGLRAATTKTADPRAPNYKALARGIGEPCVLYGGVTQSNAVQLFKDLGAGQPRARLFAADALADLAFIEELPASVARRTLLTVPPLATRAYPRAGRAFFDTYSAKYGEDDPDPYAIYGYEAMALALDAVERAGDQVDRAAVVDALLATKGRRSVLGTYSIDESGDITLPIYGVYRVDNGTIVFVRAIRGS